VCKSGFASFLELFRAESKITKLKMKGNGIMEMDKDGFVAPRLQTMD
jgi:hypothetical protein